MSSSRSKSERGTHRNIAHYQTSAQHLDDQLEQILTGLAHLLLRNGYGFSRISKLSKLAFVNAAKAIEAESPSRVSIARIAALTGLTRVEVSRLLRDSNRHSNPIGEPANRAIRVAAGWVTDKRYCTSRGQPKVLAFNSGKDNFATLVKSYSGDIPARAMLAEMKRLGMVKHSATDTIKLDRSRSSGSKAVHSAMRAIVPWIRFFAVSDKVVPDREIRSTSQKLTLKFDSLPQALAAIREVENRRKIFIEGLGQIGVRSTVAATHQLDLSVAIALAAPKPIASTSRKRRTTRDHHE